MFIKQKGDSSKMVIEKGQMLNVNGVNVDKEDVGIELVNYQNGYYELFFYDVKKDSVIDQTERCKARGMDQAFNKASKLFNKFNLDANHFKYTETARTNH